VRGVTSETNAQLPFLQVLYEYAFLHGMLEKLQAHPHQEVLLSDDTTIESLQLGSAFVLIVLPDLLPWIQVAC
jgi:hypothetical protein